eukprot:jgi/Galph1/5195/GphlegSOOS_G3812.1
METKLVEGTTERTTISPGGNDKQKTDTLKVYVRVRPLNDREKETSKTNSLCWQLNGNQIVQCCGGKIVPNTAYAFDRIFTPEDNNETVFREAASSVIESVIDGYNGTIFAYGQTSSGKTHTMLGTSDDKGIIPLSIYQVFQRIQETNEREFLLRVSYIEIYNENIRDLLAPQNENLKVHEDFSGRVFVDAKEQIVSSPEDVLEVMKSGENNRTIGATNMNERSSRSHTIFTLFIESREKERDVEAEGVSVRASTLTLVDLAGSERVSQTGAEGSRLKEGMHINRSLLTLGTVINKLCEGFNSHIPYRDSKLTRILQPALGGNSKTTVICAITPAIINIEETHSTLKFASRAKRVKINAHCNEILDEKAILSNYRKEIEVLRCQLSELQNDPQRRRSSLVKGIVAYQEDTDEVIENALHIQRKRRLDCLCQIEPKDKVRKLSFCFQTILSDDFDGNSSLFKDKVLTEVPVQTEDSVYNWEDKLRRETEAKVNLELELSRIKSENQFFKEETDRYARENYDLRDQLSWQVGESIVKEIVNATVNDHTIDVMNQQEKKLQEYRETNSNIHEMEQINRELKSNLQSMEEELKRKTNLSNYIATSRSQHILKENDSLKQKLSELESKLKSSKVLSSQTISEKQQLERDLKSLQKQMKKLQSENVKLHEANMKMKDSSASLNNIENKLETVMKEKEKALECVQELTDENQNKRQQIEQLCLKTQELELKLKESYEKIVQCESEIENLQQQEKNFQQQETKLNEEIAGLKEKVACFASEREEGKRTKEETEEKLRVTKDSYEELQKSFEEIRKKRKNAKHESSLEQSKTNLEETKVLLTQEELKSHEYCDELKKCEEKYSVQIENLTEKLENEKCQHTKSLESHKNALEKLEETEKESCSLQEQIQKLSETIVDLKRDCEVLSQEKQSLKDELEAFMKSKDQKEEQYPLSSYCQTSFINCSLYPEPGKDELVSRWKQELERVNQEMSKFHQEKRKLLATIHQRDQKLEQVENAYRDLFEETGALGKLKRKLERKELELRQVNEEFRKVEELVVAVHQGESFSNYRQLAHLQAENTSLKEELSNIQKQLTVIQNERKQLLEESSRLRKEIKKRDIHRLDIEEKFYAWKQQFLREEQCQQGKRKPPRLPLRAINNDCH